MIRFFDIYLSMLMMRHALIDVFIIISLLMPSAFSALPRGVADAALFTRVTYARAPWRATRMLVDADARMRWRAPLPRGAHARQHTRTRAARCCASFITIDTDASSSLVIFTHWLLSSSPLRYCISAFIVIIINILTLNITSHTIIVRLSLNTFFQVAFITFHIASPIIIGH